MGGGGDQAWVGAGHEVEGGWAGGVVPRPWTGRQGVGRLCKFSIVVKSDDAKTQ